MNALRGKLLWIANARDGSSAAIQTLLVKVFILAINLATGTLTARVLGADGRGEQAALLLWPALLGYLLTLGIPTALIFNFNKYPQKKSELFGAALLASLGLGGLAALVGWLGLPYWLGQYSPETILQARCLMVFAPLAVISSVVVAALEAESSFTFANQTRYVPPLLTLLFLGILFFFGALTPLTSGLVFAAAPLPILLLMFQRVWRDLAPSLKNFQSSIQNLLSYGLRSYGVELLETLTLQLDQVFVVTLLSPVDMGMYVVALNLSKMLNIVQHSIVTVLFPKAAAKPPQEVIAMTGLALRLSTMATLCMGGLLIAMSGVVLELLYGSQFLSATLLLRILAFRTILEGMSLVIAQSFMALGRPGIVTIIQGLGLGSTVLAITLLVPKFGLLGIGVALLINSLIKFSIAMACYPMVLKLSPPHLIPRSEDLRFVRQKLFA